MLIVCVVSVVVFLEGRPEDSSVFRVVAKCHRSYRKNEASHDLSCFITCSSAIQQSHLSEVHHGACSCAIGSSGCCGHIIGLLYQLADYKARNLKAIPDPVPCTSLPQEWHKPRGEKIGATKVDDMQLSSPAAGLPKSRAVCSNVYNPVAGIKLPDFDKLLSSLKDVSPNSQWLTFNTTEEVSSTSQIASINLGTFGTCVKGSVLSYQQAKDPNIIINYQDINFPSLPVNNYMHPIPFVLTEQQTVKFDELIVTPEQTTAFEQGTRLQSESSLWHHLRKSRLTASKIGAVCKRRADFDKLSCQLKRNVRSTSAMKKGLLREPIAANMYRTLMDNEVNIYPCGLIISPYAPWIAASPDRVVYNPSRCPSFGLLEIKCPQSENLEMVKCLTVNDNNSGLKLKTTHDYYYQVQCQMAVTGFDWCDFIVLLENGHLHLETIDFNFEFWRDVEQKLHNFFFNFFICNES